MILIADAVNTAIIGKGLMIGGGFIGQELVSVSSVVIIWQLSDETLKPLSFWVRL